MKSIDWKVLAESIGILAIVASLVFVGVQLQQDRNLASVQVLTDKDSAQIEWAGLLRDNLGTWMRGLDGEELDDSEHATFEMLAGVWFDKKSNLHQRVRRLGMSDGLGAATETANILLSHTGLMKAWKKRVSWMEQRERTLHFEIMVNQVLEEIESGARTRAVHESYWVG